MLFKHSKHSAEVKASGKTGIHILILIVLGFAVYSNVLSNGFIGDDHVKVEKNLFYRSLVNLPHLFDSSYLAYQNDYFYKDPPYFSSGEVSYRPMISLFYFMDYQIWHENPFGWHLDSILLHILNVVLVYIFVSMILRSEKIGLLSAVLFCVHPIQAEVVNAISYRHAMLDAFFVLWAFIFYIKGKEVSPKWGRALYVLSVVCYFLGVFSRESAVVFPVMLFLYDYFILGKKDVLLPREFFRRYIWFYVVTVFFLFIYFFVFPNTALPDNQLLGGSLGWHVLSIALNFFRYLFWLIFPMFVNVIPPLYAPDISHTPFKETIICCLSFLAFVVLAVQCFRIEKKVLLFLLWFIVFFIPVSNVIPLANPVAHRFMYLPSIGVCVLGGIFFEKILCEFRRLGYVLIVAMVLMSCSMTFSINMLWKNELRLFLALVRLYPENKKSHEVLGMAYFNLGLYQEAKTYLRKALEMGSTDPRMQKELKMIADKETESKNPSGSLEQGGVGQ